MNNSELLHAVQFDSPANVQQILADQSIDINETTSNGIEKKTALYLAVERENIEIIQLLLSHPSIDVNKKSILKLKEENVNNYYFGENANEPNTFGEHGGYLAPMYPDEAENYCKQHNNTFEKTALFLAIEKENQAIVQILLSHPKIDVNCISSRKYCAMKSPSERQSRDHIYWNTQEKGPIHIAIEKKNQEIVQLLLNQINIDMNLIYLYKGGMNFLECYSIEKSPLCVAIDAGNLSIFQMLLNHPKTNISFNIKEMEENEARGPYCSNFSVLHLAVKNNNPQMVKLLLKRPEIDVNSLYTSKKVERFTNTALNMAVEQENKEIVRLLLAHPNININIKLIYEMHIPYEYEEKKEKTALFIAIEKKNKEIAQFLLNRPEIEVNKPLLLVKTNGYSKYRGLDTVNEKKTPLCLAIENDDSDIVDFLLMKNDIDVNAPYEYVSSHELKNSRSEINETNEKILSPLFIASQKNNAKIVDHLLLHQQIDLNFESLIKDNNKIVRKTAIDLADENENQEISNLLHNYLQ